MSECNEKELPKGWFNGLDIIGYRKLVNTLHDNAMLIEIGCWKGRSLASVADLILDKKLKVIAVDTFKSNEKEFEMWKEAKNCSIYEVFVDTIKKFGLQQSVAVLKMSSEEASKSIPDSYADMVFIDADHSYEAVKNDLKKWFPKVKNNGIISGHDCADNSDVEKAVKEFFKNSPNEVAREDIIWATVK